MIEQLKTLEDTLLRIRQQYQQVKQELDSFKNKPQVDTKAHQQLINQLASSEKERDNLKATLAELDRRYQSLAEAHHLIGEEQDKLQQQVDDLTEQNETLMAENDAIKQQNNKLLEKNRVAAEHTQLVLQRLTKIDQMEE